MRCESHQLRALVKGRKQPAACARRGCAASEAHGFHGGRLASGASGGRSSRRGCTASRGCGGRSAREGRTYSGGSGSLSARAGACSAGGPPSPRRPKSPKWLRSRRPEATVPTMAALPPEATEAATNVAAVPAPEAAEAAVPAKAAGPPEDAEAAAPAKAAPPEGTPAPTVQPSVPGGRPASGSWPRDSSSTCWIIACCPTPSPAYAHQRW